jgi:PIN like domain
MPADERVDDVTWLTDSAQQGWAVLMKDKNIRRRPAEKAAVQQHAARCFCITRGDLPAQEMARRIITNVAAMATACANSGPFIYAVHETRLELLKLE